MQFLLLAEWDGGTGTYLTNADPAKRSLRDARRESKCTLRRGRTIDESGRARLDGVTGTSTAARPPDGESRALSAGRASGSAGRGLLYLANEETVHGPSAATGRQGMKSVLDEVCA